MTKTVLRHVIKRMRRKGKKSSNLLRAASIKSEPGNGDPSNAWPLDSTVSFLDLPHKILSKTDAIGSNTGLIKIKNLPL